MGSYSHCTHEAGRMTAYHPSLATRGQSGSGNLVIALYLQNQSGSWHRKRLRPGRCNSDRYARLIEKRLLFFVSFFWPGGSLHKQLNKQGPRSTQSTPPRRSDPALTQRTAVNSQLLCPRRRTKKGPSPVGAPAFLRACYSLSLSPLH
jgi:hypothetical protein